MNTFTKDLKPRSTQDMDVGTTVQTSTPKPQEDNQGTNWLDEMCELAVQNSKRMETDPKYRKLIQSQTR